MIYAVILAGKAALTESTEVVEFGRSLGAEVIELTVVHHLLSHAELPVDFYLNAAVEMLNYPCSRVNVCRFLKFHLGLTLNQGLAVYNNLAQRRTAG